MLGYFVEEREVRAAWFRGSQFLESREAESEAKWNFHRAIKGGGNGFDFGRGFARRSNLEEDLRKRREAGGGRRACGIKKGWGRRSYEAVHRDGDTGGWGKGRCASGATRCECTVLVQLRKHRPVGATIIHHGVNKLPRIVPAKLHIFQLSSPIM